MIILVRDFPRHACLSGGDELPSRQSLTPELEHDAAAQGIYA